MAEEENWGDDPVVGADTIPVAQAPELPEIKLFGRWSCDDVQVSDMSLQVNFIQLYTQQNHYNSFTAFA